MIPRLPWWRQCLSRKPGERYRDYEERVIRRLAYILSLCAALFLLALTWSQNRNYHEPDVSNLKGAVRYQASQELGR